MSELKVGNMVWNQEKNILEQKKNKVSLRGFIVRVVDSAEQYEMIKNSDDQEIINKLPLSPILAQSEDEALQVLKNQGKFPVVIQSLETLEMQINILGLLAEQNDINLLRVEKFQLNNLS